MSQDSRLKVECSTTKRLGDINILFSYFRLLFSFHDIALSFQFNHSPLDKHRTYFYDCRDTAAFSTTRPKDFKAESQIRTENQRLTTPLRYHCANPAFHSAPLWTRTRNAEATILQTAAIPIPLTDAYKSAG